MDQPKIDSTDLLDTLNIQDWQKIITIKEDNDSDGNFLISHLLKHILQDENKGVCLITLKHDLAYYQDVSKHLNYNLVEKIGSNQVSIITPMKSSTSEADGSSSKEPKRLKTEDKTDLAKDFFKKIRRNIREMKDRQSGYIYVIIDKMNCLLEQDIPLKGCLFLINMLLNFHERVNLIACVDTGSNDGQSIATALCFISDMVVTLNSLKPGSFLGLMTIQKLDSPPEQYQFKSAEKGVKIFKPGECSTVNGGSNFKLLC